MAKELKRRYDEDLRVFEGPWSRALGAALAVALAGAALGLGPYAVYVLTTLALFVVAAVALNLLVGYAGLISLGHAAFLAIGAYTHVVLYTQGVALPVSVAAGAAVAALAGLVIALPALRLEGPYLAICTLGFQVAVDQILGRWDHVTGGRMGLGVPHPEEVAVAAGWAGIDPERGFALVCLLVAGAVVVGGYNLARSRVGRSLVAVRDNDVAAAAMGVDVVRTKVLAFAVSAALTGLAGGLYAHLFDRINPSHFSLVLSIELLVMILVGGLGSILGSVLGATLLVVLQHSLGALRDAQSIVVGAVLVLVLLFEPMGLRGRWLRIRIWFQAWPF